MLYDLVTKEKSLKYLFIFIGTCSFTVVQYVVCSVFKLLLSYSMVIASDYKKLNIVYISNRYCAIAWTYSVLQLSFGCYHRNLVEWAQIYVVDINEYTLIRMPHGSRGDAVWLLPKSEIFAFSHIFKMVLWITVPNITMQYS